ncbi:DUF3574 domain-containing protein [Chelatococcus daeguensis]|uniref:Uncharacterized protein n=1 Tax=Chelatococcus sambhunathii TaxID=363953 RepID=A0ABP2A8S1_9HYPH|nr:MULTISPECIES: DUF3574 domain-containing protein [Chelatococcus]KZE34117.1 molybdenum cofactor biosynthesis protein MoaE [Chelatococcus daeguensis]MBM3082675.1 DUF3574 domain-containing protein [Chelatococcus daeguensis]CUA90891.1 hypothetical protein Ga0061061_11636 [Chelatococcus sambhunathii]
MLHQASIIIPLHDNDGSDNAPVIERTIRSLIGAFGGATAWNAEGFWMNAEQRLYVEPVKVIVAAAPKTVEARSTLRGLAERLLDDTDQEAVFVSYPDGETEIVGR